MHGRGHVHRAFLHMEDIITIYIYIYRKTKKTLYFVLYKRDAVVLRVQCKQKLCVPKIKRQELMRNFAGRHEVPLFSRCSAHN